MLAIAGQYDLARAEYFKATRLEGHPEEAHFNLILIYRAEMNFVEAKKILRKSLEIDPKDEKVRHCLNDIIKAINLTKKLQ